MKIESRLFSIDELVSETIAADLEDLLNDEEFVAEDGSLEILNALRTVAVFYGGAEYA